MNERTLHPANVAAGALLFGGLLLLAAPHHAANILRLVLATVAAAVGLYALAIHVPGWRGTGWWTSPLDRTRPRTADPPDSREVARIRLHLGNRRQHVAGAPDMPPDVLHLLQPLVRQALERAGLDPARASAAAPARTALDPLTLAVLAATPQSRKEWHATLRPDEHEVATVVHRVLDDLDRLAARGGAGEASATPHPGSPR